MLDINTIIRDIDQENGNGYHSNIRLSGNIFIRNNSFLIYRINNHGNMCECVIQYIYFQNVDDLRILIAYLCSFLLRLKADRIIYSEKHKLLTPIPLFKSLTFNIKKTYSQYKYRFICSHDGYPCHCPIITAYK